MIKGLYAAHTGMVNQMKRMDVLTNNLANADTNGYKAEYATTQSFDDVMSYRIKDMTSSIRGYTGRHLGAINLGVKIGEVYTDYSQGSLRETENTFDLALADKGFFGISFTNINGQTSFKLTRDGAFTIDNDGYLRTNDGDYVLDQNACNTGNAGQAGYIQLNPALDVTIDRDGNIWQDDQYVATVGIIDVDNYDYLEKYGENMFNIIDGGNIIAADTDVYQGYLEMSNSEVVNDMVDMIALSRAYESDQRLIQTIDSMIDIASNRIGKV